MTLRQRKTGLTLFAYCAVYFLISAALAAEEENLDDLFDDIAEEVTVDDTASVDHLAIFEKDERLKLFGSFSSEAGVAYGWKELPDSSGGFRGADGTIGAKATATLGFDAKPDSTFHVRGSSKTTFDPLAAGEYAFAEPTIEELYLDYTFVDTALIRVGKHSFTWGQGRLYTPGNIVSDSGDGFALRISFPTMLSGVSVAALAQKSFFAEPKNPSIRELVYTAYADHIVGPLRIGAGARVQNAQKGTEIQAFDGLLSSKLLALGTDFFFDAILSTSKNNTSRFDGMAGFFREWGDVKAYGEFFVSVPYDDPASWIRRSGIATAWKRAFGSKVDIATKWLHDWKDSSGCIILGASLVPFSHVTIECGLPFFYGEQGTYYIQKNEDPAKRLFAFATVIKIQGSF